MKRRTLWLLFALLIALQSSPARPQKEKKSPPPTRQKTTLSPNRADEEVLETEISKMLGAWQIGDAAMLKSFYADDVTVVSGAWEPPLVGWSNYLQAYLRQRERVQRVRLDRRNTLIRTVGNFAWATYQWDFEAMVDDRGTTARGQTTLLFQKRDSHWLIVHNHTSLVAEAQADKPQVPPLPPAPKP